MYTGSFRNSGFFFSTEGFDFQIHHDSFGNRGEKILTDERKPGLPAHITGAFKGEISVLPGAKVQHDSLGTEHTFRFLLADDLPLAQPSCIKHLLKIHIKDDLRKQRKERTMSDREYRAYAKGKSWKMDLEITVDECMAQARSREHFIRLMEYNGYEVKWTDSRKNITYTTPDGHKCCDDKMNGLNSFLFSWSSWLGFRSLYNTVSEMCVLRFVEENNKSEPVSHWENLVRIILVWCRQPDSNRYAFNGEGF